MILHSIIVVNLFSGCTNNLIEQQFTVSECTQKKVSLNLNSNQLGPFAIYVDTTGSTPIFSSVTRSQLMSGVTVNIEC
jgi:hypothetical protein